MKSRRNDCYNPEILESLYQRQLIFSPYGKDVVCDKGYNFQMNLDGSDLRSFQGDRPRKIPRPTGLFLFEWDDFMVDGMGRLFYKQSILLPEPPEKYWTMGRMVISKAAVRILQKDPIMTEEFKEKAREHQTNLHPNHKYFVASTRMRVGGSPVPRWIVGKSKGHTYELGANPFVHHTEDSARAEAVRLKKKYPQDEFHILQASTTSSREVILGQGLKP